MKIKTKQRALGIFEAQANLKLNQCEFNFVLFHFIFNFYLFLFNLFNKYHIFTDLLKIYFCEPPLQWLNILAISFLFYKIWILGL